MKIKIYSQDQVDYVSLSGDLGKPEAEELETKINSLIEEKRTNFVFDLEDIRYVDSYAIKTLLRLNREALGEGGAIKLLRPRQVVKKFLTIGRVFELFDCYETKVDAIKSFQQEMEKHKGKPIGKLEMQSRKQKETLLKLIQILANKGHIDVQQYMQELDRSSKLVFNLFRDDLKKD